MSIRVATANVENLFARYRFRSNFDATAEDGFSINNTAFDIYDNEAKRITAQALKAVKADILCLQEVENLEVLDRFNSRFMGSKKYDYRFLVDSHDPRHIDVAVLSKYPVAYARTYRDLRNAANTTFLFSRDCLEVGFKIGDKELTLYVNHFKSMIRTREETKKRREEQVEKVAAIVDQNWQDKDYEGNFIVLGDFNDYIDNKTSLKALTNHPQLVNVVDRLPEDERWTHFYKGGEPDHKYHQLDYMLLSRQLAEANQNTPEIERRGMPWRAEKFEGERFDNVGWDYPKASDHCPLVMEFNLV